MIKRLILINIFIDTTCDSMFHDYRYWPKNPRNSITLKTTSYGLSISEFRFMKWRGSVITDV